MKCPCQNCPDRKRNCHATCTHGYKEYREKLDKANKKRREYSEFDGYRAHVSDRIIKECIRKKG